MRSTIEAMVKDAVEAAVTGGELALSSVPEAAVERPRDPAHGDWATAVALRLAGELGRSPREIATVIASHIEENKLISKVEIAGPGFINLRLSNRAFHQVIRDVRVLGENFARIDAGKGRTLNIEFISANPTGPMHVGHGRWAALGNAMCNVCEYAGWQVTREFYINDAGHQMDVFGASIALRYLELLGHEIEKPEEFYGGAYVIDLAQKILDEEGSKWEHVDIQQRMEHFRERGYTLMLAAMQELCERIKVPFHMWFTERSLYEKNPKTEKSAIESMLELLRSKACLYEKDGAVWFRSTDFTDDKDRVLVKSDGSYTYFAPDIAYHLSKFNRGSEYLVNIWGADHHGYIPRMKSACAALGHEGKLDVVLGQLVNLFRDGEAVRMSKRTGEMVTFEELIDEVGADATKYLMLSRSTDQAIDFDIELAKKQDNSNPLYYVQYAHARICSLFRKAGELGERENLDNADLSLLVDSSELELARVFLQLSEVIEGSAKDLAPFKLTRYAEELATALHSFYTRCIVISSDRELTKARLYLSDATRIVLRLVLSLLGVSAPERM